MRRMFSEEQLKRLIENSSSEVINAIKDKDIQVNGITSKGIANTGGLANIGNVAISGNADVSGYIHGGEIVENMSGYTADIPATTGMTKTPVYAGAVKNGNKLTLVLAVKASRTATIGGGAVMCDFYIPSAVGSKLYVAIGTYTLFKNNIYCVSLSDTSNDVDIATNIMKMDNGHLRIQMASPDDLVLNDEYYIRVEATFLLSDSLVS